MNTLLFLSGLALGEIFFVLIPVILLIVLAVLVRRKRNREQGRRRF